MLVTYFQLVQTFFGEELYLNALNEERVVERKTENEKMLLHYVFRISKSLKKTYNKSRSAQSQARPALSI